MPVIWRLLVAAIILRFPSDRIADITIVFVIDQLFALISGRESGSGPLSVLPGPPREPIGHTDVKNRVIPIRDDVDPEVVITWHGQ